MSTTREIPCQLVLDFDAPSAPVPLGEDGAQSNVVQVFFGPRPGTLARQENDHQAIVKQVLLNAKMLSW